MPYTMQIYASELDACPVPSTGDIFVVEEVESNVTDFHWGKCVFVSLRPLAQEVLPIDNVAEVV